MVMAQNQRKQSGGADFGCLLFFLPTGVKISAIAAATKDLIDADFKTASGASRFTTMDLSRPSTPAKLKEEIGRTILAALNERKEGVVLLSGRRMEVGVSLPDVDGVVLLHELNSSDVCIQQSMRCMTEAAHKLKAFVVETFNPLRTIVKLAISYMGSSGDQRENLAEGLRHLRDMGRLQTEGQGGGGLIILDEESLELLRDLMPGDGPLSKAECLAAADRVMSLTSSRVVQPMHAILSSLRSIKDLPTLFGADGSVAAMFSWAENASNSWNGPAAAVMGLADATGLKKPPKQPINAGGDHGSGSDADAGSNVGFDSGDGDGGGNTIAETEDEDPRHAQLLNLLERVVPVLALLTNDAFATLDLPKLTEWLTEHVDILSSLVQHLLYTRLKGQTARKQTVKDTVVGFQQAMNSLASAVQPGDPAWVSLDAAFTNTRQMLRNALGTPATSKRAVVEVVNAILVASGIGTSFCATTRQTADVMLDMLPVEAWSLDSVATTHNSSSEYNFLDLCCGTGMVSAAIHDRMLAQGMDSASVFLHVRALDVDPLMVALYRLSFPEATAAQVLCADAKLDKAKAQPADEVTTGETQQVCPPKLYAVLTRALLFVCPQANEAHSSLTPPLTLPTSAEIPWGAGPA